MRAGWAASAAARFGLKLFASGFARCGKLTDKPFGVDITLPKMEDVKIPDPDEVRKEIQEKFPKHAKFNDELIPQARA